MDDRSRGSLHLTLERQSQVIARRQLLGCGIDDHTLTRKVKAGTWLRILPSVYLIPSGPLSTERRRVAAGLYAGGPAQVTGLAALHWYGFQSTPSTDRVHVLVPHERRR